MDYKKEQLEEADVIKSLYGPDIISIKTENCWKKWCPLECCIRILPSGEKAYVSADVLLQCSEHYPDMYVLNNNIMYILIP
jgi:hypothetical protein